MKIIAVYGLIGHFNIGSLLEVKIFTLNLQKSVLVLHDECDTRCVSDGFSFVFITLIRHVDVK